jgi:hypothetical protein
VYDEIHSVRRSPGASYRTCLNCPDRRCRHVQLRHFAGSRAYYCPSCLATFFTPATFGAYGPRYRGFLVRHSDRRPMRVTRHVPFVSEQPEGTMR